MAIEGAESQFRRAVGKRVLIERARRDLSQSELAAAAGVTRNFVGAVERAERVLDAYRLRKLATALGIDLEDLLSTDGRQA